MGRGSQWLTDLEETLREAGFRVERGYPGKKAVCLTGTVAAINLTGIDSFQQSAAVTVMILSPRSDGLDHCQEMAEKAVQVLSGVGGQWKFSGWRFDSGCGCFLVEVVGSVAFVSQNGSWVPDAGYQVLVGEQAQVYVTDFLARQEQGRRLIRPHGQAEPTRVTPGMGGWSIRLTQLLPTGQPEPMQMEEPFTLQVIRGDQIQTYNGCYWSEYTSQQCQQGNRVIRSGFALSREVEP